MTGWQALSPTDPLVIRTSVGCSPKRRADSINRVAAIRRDTGIGIESSHLCCLPPLVACKVPCVNVEMGGGGWHARE